ncbi:MAG: type III pantothenate kinase [Candidatus Latescibacteria bacterium]|nr:type III pantothenate kinase [Candidatus Latescibacterota bacterium]
MTMLVVDVGNTRTSAAVWTPLGTIATGDILFREFAHRPTPRDASGRAELLGALLAFARRHGLRCAAVASVVPEVTTLLMAGLPGAVAADHTAPLPFALALAEPAATGADRFCDMAAAAGAGLRDALVVDMGTATTFNVLRAGVFVGGLIAPGASLAAGALGERAARLHPVVPAPGPADPQPDTHGALVAGCYLVGVHGVVGTAAALLARHGPLDVVLTGGQSVLLGDAASPFPGTERWRRDPLWTLRGAALLGAAALR